MNIAVLSGKGGTGKTTVSANLAVVSGFHYADCDVEEPNGFLFLKPDVDITEDVHMEVPEIDPEKCMGCGACARVCQYNALAKVGKEIVVFEKMCHDCGACRLVCKTGALSYRKRNIGKIEAGNRSGMACVQGVLNVGESKAVPVIRKLLEGLPERNYMLDCPPGTSCKVVTALKYADAAILVTEPSVFGLHDLKLAVELVKMYKIPFGILLNKDSGTDNMVRSYSRDSKIPLLGTIPYGKEAAVLYSNGRMLCDDRYYRSLFAEIAGRMKEVF